MLRSLPELLVDSLDFYHFGTVLGGGGAVKKLTCIYHRRQFIDCFFHLMSGKDCTTPEVIVKGLLVVCEIYASNIPEK